MEFKDPGQDSALPKAMIAGIHKRLGSNLHSTKEIFLDLLAAWFEVKESGLTALAAQLYEMAMIGLLPSEIEKALEGEDTIRQASEQMKTGSKDRRMDGLSSPGGKSFGLRPGRKKTNR